jgi:hypothetical protein
MRIKNQGGFSRSQGIAWDIGAYEYISGSPDTTLPAAPSEMTIQ